MLTKCTSDDVSSLTSFMNGDFLKTAVPAKAVAAVKSGRSVDQVALVSHLIIQ